MGIQHLAETLCAKVKVTLKLEADIPKGAAIHGVDENKGLSDIDAAVNPVDPFKSGWYSKAI